MSDVSGKKLRGYFKWKVVTLVVVMAAEKELVVVVVVVELLQYTPIKCTHFFINLIMF